MKIIDMRCRLTTKEAAKYFATRLGSNVSRIPALQEGTEEAFFKEIADAGITTAVSVSGNSPGIKIGRRVYPDRTTSNDLMADVQKRHYGKFIGVAGIDAGNKFHNALAEIRRCVEELGLKAVYLEPGRSPGCFVSDRLMYPIYQRCVDLNVPVIFQTSVIAGHKKLEYGHPRYYEEVAEDFPDLHIICGHGCYPYFTELVMVAGKHPNIYPSPDERIFDLNGEVWERVVNEEYMGMADQFLFGSAYPFYPIKEYVEEFFSKFSWKEEVLDRILYRNALRALKLENDPVFRKMYDLDKVSARSSPGAHGKSLLWHQPVDKDGLGVA